MTYIWINPVTDRMYAQDELDDFLNRHGYERIYVREDWSGIVKEKYRALASQTKRPIVDVRCPKIRSLAKAYERTADMVLPDIWPILIHCGIESSERADFAGTEKIITTPCQALADMGNALGLSETSFVPWNQFMASTGEVLKGACPKESPIPPGFFEGTGLKTLSVTGEENIRAYFENEASESAALVEMLFCEGGCHRGDGVLTCSD